MSRRRRRIARRALMAIAASAIAMAMITAADRTPRQQIESRLMCYCGCADLTVRTCTCGVAASIREEIGDRLARGETGEQVIAAFVARHGEKILSAPTKEGFNLVAWAAPFIALFAATVVLVGLVRRWGRGAGAGGGGASFPGGPSGPLTEEERALLRRVESEIREGL